MSNSMACTVGRMRMAGVFFVPQHAVAMSPSSVYFSLKVQKQRATAGQVYVNRSSSVHRRAVCQKVNAAQPEAKVRVCASSNIWSYVLKLRCMYDESLGCWSRVELFLASFLRALTWLTHWVVLTLWPFVGSIDSVSSPFLSLFLIALLPTVWSYWLCNLSQRTFGRLLLFQFLCNKLIILHVIC